MPRKNGERFHRVLRTCSIDVIVEGKRNGRGEETPYKRDGYRVFYDVNRIGTSKVVISIPILLGHYRQLPVIDVKVAKR